MPERYKSIGLPESEYKVISEAKAHYETENNKKVDWGEFLRILALGYVIGKGLEVLSQRGKIGRTRQTKRTR